MQENSKLSHKQYIILASLLFGLFFGAGNLIFPIHLGQMAGSNWLAATSGFLISAILLPLCSILAISNTKSNSMYDLALPAGKNFALLFLILTHASLGLLVASPRTATVTFSMGVQPFIPRSWLHASLLVFSFLFFAAVFLLAYDQNSITRNVGKILNPLLILLLAGLFFVAFVLKGKDIAALPFLSAGAKSTGNFITGFLEGYNTMDALAGLGFGVTIVAALRNFGQSDSRLRSRSVGKIGALTMGFEALIYLALIVLGAASLGYMKMTAEGGSAFTVIMRHYTGMIGAALLAALTLLACLTTAIGLITSLAQDLSRRFPQVGYHRCLFGAAAISFLIANFGLEQIIAYSSPLLSFLYPLAIALILLGLMAPLIGQNKIIYKTTITLTMIPAILDLIHTLPPVFAQTTLISSFDSWAGKTILLYNVGLDFLPFMLAGLLLGWLLSKFKQDKTVAETSEI
ncbi:branched-chain amino acid permease [Ligilactobacillus salitolerans]|uniref:Branched-chain amino acid transport system carrier protein n=1 Tax=Ligilactobacillus salitolerans TaxID=1808352 RepID=A0A401ITA0_9LACO|nr:branched-chain amino acid transport system II carrier protein [Ligilactobacillus salitolerans]GBG94773.1 branched-chain amino acid permease [Ligilactobacillus salitolerans]